MVTCWNSGVFGGPAAESSGCAATRGQRIRYAGEAPEKSGRIVEKERRQQPAELTGEKGLRLPFRGVPLLFWITSAGSRFVIIEAEVKGKVDAGATSFDQG